MTPAVFSNIKPLRTLVSSRTGTVLALRGTGNDFDTDKFFKINNRYRTVITDNSKNNKNYKRVESIANYYFARYCIRNRKVKNQLPHEQGGPDSRLLPVWAGLGWMLRPDPPSPRPRPCPPAALAPSLQTSFPEPGKRTAFLSPPTLQVGYCSTFHRCDTYLGKA